jgi:hypothetical protein
MVYHQQVVERSIWFDHAFIRNYICTYPSIDSLDFIGRPNPATTSSRTRERLRRIRIRHLACQKERQISLRSHTLDGGFVKIHQRLNKSERSATTTGYVEWYKCTVLITRTGQIRALTEHIALKDLHDIIRTKHIPVERKTKWWNTTTVGTSNPSEVLQEFV